MISDFEKKTKTITITNLKIKNHLIIYTSNCELKIEINGKVTRYKQNSFVSIEKGVSINCTIKKIDATKMPWWTREGDSSNASATAILL